MNAVGSFAERPDHFVVVFMSDQNHAVSFVRVSNHLEMNFGNQRTRGIDDAKPPGTRFFPDIGRDAVRAENSHCAIGNLFETFDKDCPLSSEFVHDEAIVHNFFSNVDRRTESLQGDFYDVDGSDDAGAESPRSWKKNSLLYGIGFCGNGGQHGNREIGELTGLNILNTFRPCNGFGLSALTSEYGINHAEVSFRVTGQIFPRNSSFVALLVYTQSVLARFRKSNVLVSESARPNGNIVMMGPRAYSSAQHISGILYCLASRLAR